MPDLARFSLMRARIILATAILTPIIAMGQATRPGDASTLNGHPGSYYLDRSHHTGAGGGGSGTVTSVTGTGNASGLTLSGTGTTAVTLTLSGTVIGNDSAYDRTTWNNNLSVPSKNALSDKIQLLEDAITAAGSGTVTSVAGVGTVSGLTLTGTVTTTGSLTLGGTLAGDDTAYDATSWNSNTAVPTKNAVRDKFESMGSGMVTSVTGTAPIVSSGGATPAISISAATTSAAGSMSAADKTKLDAQSGANTGDQDLSGYVPTSRTVNGHALSSNITVTPADLSLVIGTNVQAYDADLDGWAAKTPFAGSLTITTGKTFAVSNTLTLSGTDSSTLNIGTGGTLGTAAYTATGAYDASGAATAAQAAAVQRSNHTGTQTISTISDATTVGANLVKATNPSAISFPKVAADNTVSFRTPTQVLGDIGAQASGSYLLATDIDTSAELAAILTDENGSGKVIFAAGTLAIATGKTATFSNTLTLAGTDSTTMTFPTTSATIARRDTGQTFTGSNAFTADTACNGTGTQFYDGNGRYRFKSGVGNNGLRFDNTGGVWWTNTNDSNDTPSTGVYQNAAGVIEINNGTAGTYRDIKFRTAISDSTVRLKGYTVATLPASPTQGDIAMVTDALAPSFLVTIVGGGSVVTQVLYNGTNWVAQ